MSALAREALDEAKRKRSGAYHTDFRLAQHLAAGISERLTPGAKVVDPACGAGILLTAVAMAACGADRQFASEWLAHSVFAADLSENALRGTLIALACLTDDVSALAKMRVRWRVQDSLLVGPDGWRHATKKGFDVVVANPPWEKVKISRHEFIRSEGGTRHYGADYAAFDTGKYEARRAQADSYGAQLAALYPALGSGEPDLYVAFSELLLQLAKPGGTVALLLPAGLIRSQGTQRLREELLAQSSDVSRHGRLLSSDRLRAVSSANADLSTLVARALIQMYWDNHRRPIRNYRRRAESHFAIEGEVDPEDFRMPTDDGFAQTVIRFDRTNPYNAAVSAACARLLPEVQDVDVQASLKRIIQSLGTQVPLRSLRARRLPSRSRAWQSTYELALDVLRGFGVTYDGGNAVAPGFVLSTWQAWEDLVTLGLRAHLGSEAVAAQKGIQLGHRHRHAEGGWSSHRSLMVTPDLKISGSKAGFGDLLVDAKYKGRWHQGRLRVEEADVYEAMAFAKAAATDRIVLVYPKAASAPPTPVGTTTTFERVDVDGLAIWGVEAEVRGISGKAGLKKFAAGLVDALGAIANS